MATNNANEVGRRAYLLAVKKGFHTNPLTGMAYDPTCPMRVGDRIAMIQCEISEAVECVARGSTRARLGEGGKPEGWASELADVGLRTLDLAYSHGVNADTPFFGTLAGRAPLSCPTDPHDARSAQALVFRLNALSGALQLVAPYEHLAAAWECGGHYKLSGETRVPVLRGFLRDLFQLAADTGVDLWQAMEAKHRFNETRPLMHGGKLL